jgi:hypothetical protein
MFFDKETGFFNLDEQIHLHPSFQKIMEDQIVTDEEITEQSQLVIKLLKELEAELSPTNLKKVGSAFIELGVLYAVTQIRQLQDINQ